MCQSDDIVSIKQWGIYILLDHYYNGAPEPIITQLLSVLVNSYHHVGIATVLAVKPKVRVDGFNSVILGS